MSAESEELTALRARVAELEAQLAEQSRTTNVLVARAEERLYWYDRWGIDLERVMAHPLAPRLIDALKQVRPAIRWMRRTKRRLTAR